MFRIMKRIIRWSGAYKKRLYLGVVCSFFASMMSAGPTMTAAWALGRVLEDYWGNTPLPRYFALKTVLAVAAFIILRFLFSWGRAVLQESIGHENGAECRLRIGDILKRVSLSYFSQNSIGDILAGVTTELSYLELQSMKMVDAVLNGYIQFLAVALCLVFFSPAAAGAAVLGVILSAFALNGISKKSGQTAGQSHEASEKLSGASVEYIRGLQVVKAFGQSGAAFHNFRTACSELKSIHIKIEKGFVPYNCLHLFSLKLASVCIVLICAWQAFHGQIDMTVFLMFVLFSFVLFNGVESINDAAHVLSVVDSAMDKLEKLEKEAYIDAKSREIVPPDHEIKFSHVSFGYDSREILHDISFTIPEHMTAAIVGPSGSGKSTVCSLIARFYDVSSGSITLGGVDIREMTCDSLLRNISMVFQNVYLFRDTVKNNIKFGCPQASDEQVIEAAKAACCHEFITALPQGYDTVVGEGGSSLSGGEKQRISIARAILKNAPVVILDEATASIDPENEHLIQEALTALTKGKTIITIAHRLATIENAGQILVLDQGKIVQQGTHAELVSQKGLYRDFIKIREQTEGWQIE